MYVGLQCKKEESAHCTEERLFGLEPISLVIKKDV